MPREGTYKRLSARAQEGDFELVAPLDYKILEKLPEEGTTFAELYPIGASVRDLRRDFAQIAPTVLSSRLRSLHAQGLVIKVKTFGSNKKRGDAIGNTAWQQSKLGRVMLNEWKESHGNGSH